MIDRKARQILFNAYWRDRRSVCDNEFEYAKEKGLMFDPLAITHDDLVVKLTELRGKIDMSTVADAFLASLSTRRLDLRSALGSFAVASHFPNHTLASSSKTRCPSGAELCNICGIYSHHNHEPENLNVLNFERHKWGGVRHDDPIYVWFDLSQFLITPKLQSTSEDRAILREVLKIANGLPENARPSVLAKAISGVLKSNEAERRVLIEILCFSGILQPKSMSGYFGEFTMAFEREHTGEHANDWHYPAIWWRGSDGVNASAVARYYPDL